MTIEVLGGDIHLIDLKTRLPFRYGIATMTEAPHAFVRLHVRVDDREASGVAADLLPPKWFTKVPETPLDDEIDEMLTTIEQAVTLAEGCRGETAFDLWRELYDRQSAWGHQRGWPPLLVNFGMTLVERAMIEAVARAKGSSWSQLLHSGELGLRLGECEARLEGLQVGDLLPRELPDRVIARHTVGMADPLTDEEIDESSRLGDGLPQSLAACLDVYGLCHLKIKVNGDLDADRQRLRDIAALVDAAGVGGFGFTLDGNEQFRDLDTFRGYWETLSSQADLGEFLSRLMFVEQPFHRDVALDESVLGGDDGLAGWSQRPRMIIDESDAETDSLARALALGYHGTSHKNCKGVFRGVINACLLARLNQQSVSEAGPGYIMSGEDLANIGPVALLQDLAVASTLGVTSIERNGHHYFSGLEAFPGAVGDQILAAHPDLYHRSSRGWPTLDVRGGRVSLGSLHRAPLGVGFELDVEQFTPSSAWRNAR
ncbi:MAG: hypothetical protein CMJ65_10500 [Planctomycetaceae bacterium]|jgi:hypothetical protein|nr:hypothetical protein [Planctomycetaceae bacterium]MDP7276821.1 hypothetical protein [Planctomycetaceae bacterium]